MAEARDSGLTVEANGSGMGSFSEARRVVGSCFGIAVAAVVLVITFGSLVAAGLPLLTAIIGVGIGLPITALGHVLDLGSTTSPSR